MKFLCQIWMVRVMTNDDNFKQVGEVAMAIIEALKAGVTVDEVEESVRRKFMKRGSVKVFDMTTGDEAQFLIKKGLSRDRANLVSVLIKLLGDLKSLRRITHDSDVSLQITELMSFIQEEIQMCYTVQQVDDVDVDDDDTPRS